MKSLPYVVWRGAWERWPNRRIIHCSYCNGLHPANDVCAAKYYQNLKVKKNENKKC